MTVRVARSGPSTRQEAKCGNANVCVFFEKLFSTICRSCQQCSLYGCSLVYCQSRNVCSAQEQTWRCYCSFSLSASEFLIREFEFIWFLCQSLFRNYSVQSFTVDNLEEILQDPKFDQNKPTAVYSYGFTQTVYQPSVRNIVDAYLENGDFNLLLINYNSILAYTVLVSWRNVVWALTWPWTHFYAERRSVCRQDIQRFIEAI